MMMTQTPTPLIKKLGIKPGHTILILNAPEGYLDTLGTLPEGAEIETSAGGSFDCVQLFVNNRAELDKAVKGAIQAMKPGGLLWIAFQKQSSKIKSDLNRDLLWQAMQPTGLQPVTAIAINEVCSSLRFRPES